ncbi:methyl-CpG-binding domain-containing protein 2-like protein isoform X1 [Tanacetum coccineum]|uniref:Methyl-CpG-binding domain-containing protein 2-like protein isoform X1 n=1 Tax=Tanacetum coccineum TaxID=301880 RepID=A0ABQ5H9R2_9ASTR
MKSVKETVKIRVCRGGAWEQSRWCVGKAVSERLDIDASSGFMLTYNSDNDIVEGVELRVGAEDRLVWSLDQQHSFSVKKLASLIDYNILRDHSLGSKSHTWNSLVPKKVNIHIWRLAKDRLHLLSKLLRLGINVDSVMCPLCGEVPKFIDHIMGSHGPHESLKPIWRTDSPRQSDTEKQIPKTPKPTLFERAEKSKLANSDSDDSSSLDITQSCDDELTFMQSFFADSNPVRQDSNTSSNESSVHIRATTLSNSCDYGYYEDTKKDLMFDGLQSVGSGYGSSSNGEKEMDLVEMAFSSQFSLVKEMALNNAQTKTNSSAFRSMLEKHQLTGQNFNEWLRALKLVVRTEKLHDVFETPLPPAPAASADNQALADWNALFDRQNEVACLILGTMSPKLYQQFENKSPQEMIIKLQNMYGKPPGVELQELVNMFHSCKQAKGQSVSDHVLLMKSYLD